MNVTKKSALIALSLAVIATVTYVYTLGLEKEKRIDLSNYPTFIATDTNGVIYNENGKVDKTIVAAKTEYYESKLLYKFDKPLITSYNYSKDSADLWHIKGLSGEMIQDTKATVTGNVLVYPGFKDPVIDRATADNLTYTFETNDVSSPDLVTIYGNIFETKGTLFNFNLNTNVLTYKGTPNATYYTPNK